MADSETESKDEEGQITQPHQILLRTTKSTNYLNNPFIKPSRLNGLGPTNMSVDGINKNPFAAALAKNPNPVEPVKTPTESKFEFAKPLRHQNSNSSLSSTSVSNLKFTSSPIKSVKSPDKSLYSEKNAKYLSVIDLYDDDEYDEGMSPMPSEMRNSNGFDRSGLDTDPIEPAFLHLPSPIVPPPIQHIPALGHLASPVDAEPIYSPGSAVSFNFVSKGFEDSAEDVAQEPSRPAQGFGFATAEMKSPPALNNGQFDSRHGKQQTLYYSPNSTMEELQHSGDSCSVLEKDEIEPQEERNVPSEVEARQLYRSISQKFEQPVVEPEPPLPSKIVPVSYATTPVSYATTPSTKSNGNSSVNPSGNPNGSVTKFSAHVTKSLDQDTSETVSTGSNITVSVATSNSNVRNFINNNQSLLSLQSQKSPINEVVIESSNLLESDRDRYGFKKKTNFINEEQYNTWWKEYEPYLIRRKKKWVALLKQNGLNLNNDRPVRFPPKSNKLKRYVRKGIPAEWRGNAWWYFSRGEDRLKDNPGLYDSILSSINGNKTQDSDIIERDLNRTFPDNLYFRNSDSEGEETSLVLSLRRVLVAFATYQPQIGYCQSLNFLAGLLLIFLNEEKSFWMLVIITSRLLPGVHDITLEGVNVDQGVLMLCIKEYLPQVWNKIGFNFDELSNGKQSFNTEVNVVTKLPPITLCTASWFMSAYIGILPIETCLRVWDCFFYEESKVFFRIGLSIMKLAEPRIEKVRDEMEVFQIIQNFPKKLLEPQELFDVCFKKRHGFSNLSQEEITRCRKFVKEQRQKATLQVTSPVEKAPELDVEIVKLKKELDDSYIPEEYDFRKYGLAGVHWNKSLAKKLRKQRKKK